MLESKKSKGISDIEIFMRMKHYIRHIYHFMHDILHMNLNTLKRGNVIKWENEGAYIIDF